MSDGQWVRTGIILALFSVVPYAIVSWIYMKLTDGGMREFWIAMGLLFLARLFFSLIEWLGTTLMWRLYGKRESACQYLALMREQNFPQRRYRHYDFSSQLAVIEEDGSEFPLSVQRIATEWRCALLAAERSGILPGMRAHAAIEAAYDLYSPKALAPEFPPLKAAE